MYVSCPLFVLAKYIQTTNFLEQYLGEEGENCLLSAAVVCANPWNLDVANVALRSTWIGAEVYSAHMAVSLVKLFNQ